MMLSYFNLSEFDCQETGENAMDEGFLYALDDLREECGFPFVITSGYRSTEHSIEANKSEPGPHSRGIAADIACTSSSKRHTIVQLALEMGCFTGIGIHSDFIHLDMDDRYVDVMWVYGS